MRIHVYVTAGMLCLGSISAAEPTAPDQESGQLNTSNAKKHKAKFVRESAAQAKGKTGQSSGKRSVSSGGDYDAHNTGSLHDGEKTGFIQPHFRGKKVQREAANRNKTEIGTDGGIWHAGKNNNQKKVGVAVGDANDVGREAAARNGKSKAEYTGPTTKPAKKKGVRENGPE